MTDLVALRRPTLIRYPGWLAALALLVAALVSPYIPIVTSIVTGSGSTWDHLRSTVLGGYLADTALLLVGAVAGALVIGLGTAWILSLYDFPGRPVLEVLVLLPLALPVYVAAFTWSGILGYHGTLFRLSGIYFRFSGFPAAWFVFSLGLSPYVYLAVRAALLSGSRRFFEAAASLSGPSRRERRRAVVRGVLPLMRPALVAGGSLVTMEVLGAYATPLYFGIETVSTGVYRTWFGLGDLPAAMRLALVSMGLVLLLLGLERAHRGGGSFSSVPTGPVVRRVLRGRRAVGAAAAVLSTTLLGFVVPIMQLIWWTPAGMRGGAATELPAAIMRTAVLGGAATAITVMIAVVFGFSVYLFRNTTTRIVVGVASAGYAIPGTVMAIGVLAVFQYLRELDGRIFLFGTVGGLLFAYTARYLSVAFHQVSAAMEGQRKPLLDAARSLGDSPVRVLRRVAIPVFRPAVVAASVLVAVDVVKDIPITILLRPFDFSTLAVQTWALAGDERIHEAAPYALILVAVGVGAILFISRAGGVDART